ncbi:DNA2/NAM7-like helicase like protein [Aduncisulcus paluster]|uniref:DNA2/NAM7-like helicase like protein n=1 Tax=Aduncisulcus paluster TaxID=2918883 RepID=A0ABQ5K4T2_9EUKA|nr:DNA2/NAM7-like helicase like protein [Aduncisulcus paluster]
MDEKITYEVLYSKDRVSKKRKRMLDGVLEFRKGKKHIKLTDEDGEIIVSDTITPKQISQIIDEETIVVNFITIEIVEETCRESVTESKPIQPIATEPKRKKKRRKHKDNITSEEVLPKRHAPTVSSSQQKEPSKATHEHSIDKDKGIDSKYVPKTKPHSPQRDAASLTMPEKKKINRIVKLIFPMVQILCNQVLSKSDSLSLPSYSSLPPFSLPRSSLPLLSVLSTYIPRPARYNPPFLSSDSSSKTPSSSCDIPYTWVAYIKSITSRVSCDICIGICKALGAFCALVETEVERDRHQKHYFKWNVESYGQSPSTSSPKLFSALLSVPFFPMILPAEMSLPKKDSISSSVAASAPFSSPLTPRFFISFSLPSSFTSITPSISPPSLSSTLATMGFISPISQPPQLGDVFIVSCGPSFTSSDDTCMCQWGQGDDDEDDELEYEYTMSAIAITALPEMSKRKREFKVWIMRVNEEDIKVNDVGTVKNGFKYSSSVSNNHSSSSSSSYSSPYPNSLVFSSSYLSPTMLSAFTSRRMSSLPSLCGPVLSLLSLYSLRSSMNCAGTMSIGSPSLISLLSPPLSPILLCAACGCAESDARKWVRSEKRRIRREEKQDKAEWDDLWDGSDDNEIDPIRSPSSPSRSPSSRKRPEIGESTISDCHDDLEIIYKKVLASIMKNTLTQEQTRVCLKLYRRLMALSYPSIISSSSNPLSSSNPESGAVHVLRGVYGSGKTHLLSSIVHALHSSHPNLHILVLSLTHRGVDEVCERVAQWLVSCESSDSDNESLPSSPSDSGQPGGKGEKSKWMWNLWRCGRIDRISPKLVRGWNNTPSTGSESKGGIESPQGLAECLHYIHSSYISNAELEDVSRTRMEHELDPYPFVIGMTLNAVLFSPIFSNNTYYSYTPDLIIIDEASQINEELFLGVLMRIFMKKKENKSLDSDGHSYKTPEDSIIRDSSSSSSSTSSSSLLCSHSQPQYIEPTLLLVGDDRQLPPISVCERESVLHRLVEWSTVSDRGLKKEESSHEEERGGFDGHRSLPSYVLTELHTQFRLHPSISFVPSQLFYFGNVKTHWSVRTKREQAWSGGCGMIVLHVTSEEECSRDKHINPQLTGSVGISSIVRASQVSMAEAFNIAMIISLFVSNGVNLNDIGVISPYNAQCECIRDVLKRKGIPVNSGKKIQFSMSSSHHKQHQESVTSSSPLHSKVQESGSVSVSTVDSFQGSEKDIILFSLTHPRAHESSHCMDRRRMCVALTRAKRLCIVLMAPNTLGIWGDLCELVKEHGGGLFNRVEDLWKSGAKASTGGDVTEETKQSILTDEDIRAMWDSHVISSYCGTAQNSGFNVTECVSIAGEEYDPLQFQFHHSSASLSVDSLVNPIEEPVLSDYLNFSSLCESECSLSLIAPSTSPKKKERRVKWEDSVGEKVIGKREEEWMCQRHQWEEVELFQKELDAFRISFNGV